MKNRKSVHFHKPFREKATFTKGRIFKGFYSKIQHQSVNAICQVAHTPKNTFSENDVAKIRVYWTIGSTWILAT